MKIVMNAELISVIEAIESSKIIKGRTPVEMEDLLVARTFNQKLETIKARDARREKRLENRADRAFRAYHQICIEKGFPLREKEFLRQYPFAEPIVAKGAYGIAGWESYVADKLRGNYARAKLF